MQKVTYGDGHWLELREPDELTVAGRRKLRAIMTSVVGPMQRLEVARDAELAKLGLTFDEATEEQTRVANTDATLHLDPPLTEDEADRMMQLQQAGLVATIGRWSRPEEVSRAALDNMKSSEYDPLEAAADKHVGALLKAMNVDFEPSPSADIAPNPADDIPFGGSPA